MPVLSTDAPPRAVGEEIRLIDTVIVLWRYKTFVITLPVVLALIALVFAWRTTPQYEAISRVEVKTPDGRVVPAETIESMRTRVGSLLLAERIAAQQSIEMQGRKLSGEELVRHVTAQAVRNSAVILIRARFSDPELAARVANLTAEAATAQPLTAPPDSNAPAISPAQLQLEESRLAVEEFHDRAPKEFWQSQGPPRRISRLDTEYERLMAIYRTALGRAVEDSSPPPPPMLVLADRAAVPLEAISPRVARDVGIALAVGLFAAIMLVLIIDAARTRLASMR